LAGAVGSEDADMLFFKGTRKMISGKQIYTILASNIAISAPRRRTPESEHQGGYRIFSANASGPC